MCQANGKVTAASVVDHIIPHRGDDALFWDLSNWQALCKPHHDIDKQRIEHGGHARPMVGIDGWPADKK
jgi:5-methylcytosine-specific restriction endonuclease McrA